jgi:cytochrome c peroxidase
MKKYISVLCSFVLGMIALAAFSGCSKENPVAPELVMNPGNSPIPTSAGIMVVPSDNSMSDPNFAARAELGRHLFFDKSLSVDGSTSCGSCHEPTIGFADPRRLATSMGFEQQMGTRNAPTLTNVAYNSFLTWDGRFPSLEKHAPGPIFNSLEMGNNFSRTFSPQSDTVSSGYHSAPGGNDTSFLFKRLNGKGSDMAGIAYPRLFQAAWGTTKISLDLIAKSIACFERTIVSTNSTFDQFNTGKSGMTQSQLHGFQLFTDTKNANCIGCHSGYNFTDQQFHNNGIGIGKDSDSGRTNITKKSEDLYMFKTPSLRNVASTGPYMHDGRFTTLQQVLKNYNQGGMDPYSLNKDSKIHPLGLSDADISDIIDFLGTLSDKGFTNNTAFLSPWAN